jgi:hypothetical protein
MGIETLQNVGFVGLLRRATDLLIVALFGEAQS